LQGVPAGCIQQAASAAGGGETHVAEEEEEVGVETSFEELAKRAEGTEEEEEEEIILDLGRGDDKAEALIEKVIPPQPNEFTCRNCFLVKHRSQLADKKKMFCRDCA
jgi:hypothetical protein